MGKAGTSTNRQQGRQLLCEEVIEAIEKLADQKHKDNLLLLLCQLSTFLSVVSSLHNVELKKFKDLYDSTAFN